MSVCDPVDCSLLGSLSMGFPRHEYWSERGPPGLGSGLAAQPRLRTARGAAQRSRARCPACGEDRPEPPARHPSPCVLCPGISGLQAKPASPYKADADFSFSEGRRSSCSGRSREGTAGAGEAFPERRARAPGEEEGIWNTHCSDSS